MKFFATIRAILFILFLVPFTILWVLLALAGLPFFNILKWGNFISYYWNRIVLFLSGVEVVSGGVEHLPKEGCLFVFNHRSYYDVPGLGIAFKKTFRYGAKSELFKIPFFGWALKWFGTLPIHRGNREKVLRLHEN